MLSRIDHDIKIAFLQFPPTILQLIKINYTTLDTVHSLV